MKQTNICVACGGNMNQWFKHGHFTYFRCNKCQTVKTSPLPSETSIMHHYASKFRHGNYFLARRFHASYQRVYQQFVNFLAIEYAKRGGSLKHKRVLDVGCFTGDFLVLLAKSGANVFGSELQPEAVALANHQLPGRIMQADIGSQAFPPGKYDVVTMLGLIEHVTDPLALLKATHRLLKHDGVLMLQTPDSGSRLSRFLGRWWPPLTPIEHIHVFSASGLCVLLETQGFTQIRIQPHVKWLPVVYVYHQFANFGTHFMRFLKPFDWLFVRLPDTFALPFYGGEMIVIARKT